MPRLLFDSSCVLAQGFGLGPRTMHRLAEPNNRSRAYHEHQQICCLSDSQDPKVMPRRKEEIIRCQGGKKDGQQPAWEPSKENRYSDGGEESRERAPITQQGVQTKANQNGDSYSP